MPEEEDYPQPREPDELPESFHEQEDQPPPERRQHRVSLVLAIFATALACCLGVRVFFSSARHALPEAGPVLPTQTKSSDRREQEQAGQPLAAYQEKCRKGMTSREVRWIIEDFQKSGVEFGDFWLCREVMELSPEQMWQAAVWQRHWYVDAVAESLGLTPGQRREALAGASRALAGPWEKFASCPPDPGPVDEIDRIIGTHQRARRQACRELLEPGHWLMDEALAPSKLCALSPGQELPQEDAAIAEAILAFSSDGDSELRLEDFTPVRMMILDREDVAGLYEDSLSPWQFIKRTFPLQETQKLFPQGGSLLDAARALHPAQLKMLLLFKPQLAALLEKEIEQAGPARK